RIMELVEDGKPWSKAGLAAAAGVSPSVVDGLINAGTLRIALLPPQPVAFPPDPSHAAPDLTPEQSAAAAELRDMVAAKRFSVALLDGVTGSGKTETYFEAVA